MVYLLISLRIKMGGGRDIVVTCTNFIAFVQHLKVSTPLL